MIQLLHPEFSDSAILLKAIFDTAIDGIITIDDKGIMQMVNPGAAKLFCYDTEEMIGQKINILMPEPHHSHHDSYLKKYQETGVARIIGIGREVNAVKKDGSIFPIRLSISEIKLEDKSIYTGIIHDLTAQKKIQVALRDEKEKAQMYFDLANTINVVLDTEGQVLQLNKLGCKFVGLEEKEAIGQNWFDIVIPKTDRSKIKRAFAKAMQDRSISNAYFENEEINKNGNPRYFAWHSTFIKGKDGYPIAIMSSGVDITEKKQAEQAIKKMNKELEDRVAERTEELEKAVSQLLLSNQQLATEIKEREKIEAALRASEIEIRASLEKEKELSELKSRFVTMASHEFRTPLSTILSSTALVEMYQQDGAKDKQGKHIQRIRSAVGNLTNILNDFLSLSKLEEGKIANQPVDFNLKEFCQSVMDEIGDSTLR